jgi:hypothetical protein
MNLTPSVVTRIAPARPASQPAAAVSGKHTCVDGSVAAAKSGARRELDGSFPPPAAGPSAATNQVAARRKAVARAVSRRARGCAAADSAGWPQAGEPQEGPLLVPRPPPWLCRGSIEGGCSLVEVGPPLARRQRDRQPWARPLDRCHRRWLLLGRRRRARATRFVDGSWNERALGEPSVPPGDLRTLSSARACICGLWRRRPASARGDRALRRGGGHEPWAAPRPPPAAVSSGARLMRASVDTRA